MLNLMVTLVNMNQVDPQWIFLKRTKFLYLMTIQNDILFTCFIIFRLDFEIGLQKWIQFNTDDFNFDIQSGKTSSSGTGPQTDHTLQEEHGQKL